MKKIIERALLSLKIFFLKVDFSNFWLFFLLDQVESFRMVPISWVNSTDNHEKSLLKNSKKKFEKKFFSRFHDS